MTPFAVLAAVAFLAAGAPPQVVHSDGRIGPFRVGVTTRAQLVAALGKPRLAIDATPRPSAKRLGVHLGYSCGTNCDTVYSFSDKTGTLSDFATESSAFTTERGSHAGMSAKRAAMLEGRRPVSGCGRATVIRVRWDAVGKLGVGALKGRVTSIAYVGPSSTYVKPFC